MPLDWPLSLLARRTTSLAFDLPGVYRIPVIRPSLTSCTIFRTLVHTCERDNCCQLCWIVLDYRKDGTCTLPICGTQDHFRDSLHKSAPTPRKKKNKERDRQKSRNNQICRDQNQHTTGAKLVPVEDHSWKLCCVTKLLTRKVPLQMARLEFLLVNSMLHQHLPVSKVVETCSQQEAESNQPCIRQPL